MSIACVLIAASNEMNLVIQLSPILTGPGLLDWRHRLRAVKPILESVREDEFKRVRTREIILSNIPILLA